MARQDKNCCTPFKTTCGGQALLEGILMQGPEKRAIVVRRPNGELSIEEEAVKPRSGLAKLPFIRGLFIFGGSMVHGMMALRRSAELTDDGSAPEEELTGLDKWISDHFEQDKAMGIIITLAAVLGIAFSIGLFILLPTALTGLLGLVWTGMPLWVRSVIEGVLKVAIFMIYLYLCSKMKEIHRVFEYHGAEHKTIYCYEKGLELTVEIVRWLPRLHHRVHPAEDREHLPAHGAASADAAPHRGGDLRVQPLCGRPRRAGLPRPPGPRHVDAELHHL